MVAQCVFPLAASFYNIANAVEEEKSIVGKEGGFPVLDTHILSFFYRPEKFFPRRHYYEM